MLQLRGADPTLMPIQEDASKLVKVSPDYSAGDAQVMNSLFLMVLHICGKINLITIVTVIYNGF